MGSKLKHDASSTCKEILAVRDLLWTWVTEDGIEPTNNIAERDLRPAVIMRKTSGGTQSELGSRFVERMITVSQTLTKQKRNIFDFLSQLFLSPFNGLPAPTLLP